MKTYLKSNEPLPTFLQVTTAMGQQSIKTHKGRFYACDNESHRLYLVQLLFGGGMICTELEYLEAKKEWLYEEIETVSSRIMTVTVDAALDNIVRDNADRLTLTPEGISDAA